MMNRTSGGGGSISAGAVTLSSPGKTGGSLFGQRTVAGADVSFAAVGMSTPPKAIKPVALIITATVAALIQVQLDAQRFLTLAVVPNVPLTIPAHELWPEGLSVAPSISAEVLAAGTVNVILTYQ